MADLWPHSAWRRATASPRQEHILAVVGQVSLAGSVQVLGLPGDGSVLQAGGQEADMAKALRK